MCGRYALVSGKKVLLTWQKLRELERSGNLSELQPRYNAAPNQNMPVVALRDDRPDVRLMKWGLVPHWSKEPETRFSTINAKSETLEQSKLYLPYFRSSRCLIPADAFYEWQRISVEKETRGKRTVVEQKQPVCIMMKDESPFMFAGLYSVWKSPDGGEEVPTYTIITTSPNALLEKVHNRMPVIMDEKNFDQWLDPGYKETEKLSKLLKPYPAAKMKAYPVSRLVNSPKNDVPECLKPLEPETS
jgi:putative SOS response-associated peptidase YedK